MFIMKRQVFFIQLSFRTVLFCFIFEKTRLFHILCYLVMQEKVQVKLSEAAVRRCSSKQVFLKISQCWQKAPMFKPLFNKAGGLKPVFLLKNRFQRRCFPMNIAKFLRTAFLWITFCSFYFYMMIEIFGRLLVQN